MLNNDPLPGLGVLHQVVLPKVIVPLFPDGLEPGGKHSMVDISLHYYNDKRVRLTICKRQQANNNNEPRRNA